VLKPNGLLFLSTLSTRDPEHSEKGTPISGEINSFVDNVYLHLCERSELEEDFSFLKIEELYEHEYFEPRATGETHHHISWILVSRNKRTVGNKGRHLFRGFSDREGHHSYAGEIGRKRACRKRPERDG